MGIPYYFYKLSVKHKEILEKKSKRPDYLMFDFNSLLHPLTAEYLTRDRAENETIEEMDKNSTRYSLEYTKKIISQVNPKLGVYIVLDGVAPRAKLKQQRHRRFKSCYIEKKTRVWDSNKITPGTEYMYKLDDTLTEFCRENGYNYSSWKEPGEGEHKIFKILGGIGKGKEIYIYGMDADLIILSLMYSVDYSVTLFRDDSTKEEVTTVDIDALKKITALDLKPKRRDPDLKRLVNDYSLLMCLLGNDFLESIPTLSILDGGMDVILDVYRQLDKYITTETGEINFKNFLEILYKLEKSESGAFSRWCRKTVVFKDTEDILDDSITVYNNTDLVCDKKRYYTFYNILEPGKAAENYTRGLQWVMGYYNNHNHDNWSYVYEYTTSPFLSDIIQYIKRGVNETPFIRDEPVKPLHQLFLVLPETSLRTLVQKGDKHKIETLLNMEWIKKYFDEKLIMDYIQKDRLWKGRLMYPELLPAESLMTLEHI